MNKILAIILAATCSFTGSAIDADALYAQLNSTRQGREILHGAIRTNSVQVVINTNALIKVTTQMTLYADGYRYDKVTTNAFSIMPPARVQPTSNLPDRYAAIRAMREAAGWVAKPPRERPPKVHVYSVMKCVQAAQQMGLWESAIKPFLITNNLIELVYTAQDFRSDNPNFKTAIQALTGMGIDQATIDAALKTAEIEGGK